MHTQQSVVTVTHTVAPHFHLSSPLPPAKLPLTFVPGDGKVATNNEGLAEIRRRQPLSLTFNVDGVVVVTINVESNQE